MATQIIKTVFQFRRATTAEWIAHKDVIPAAGEPCFDIDLNTLKIGNGVDTYENLDIISGVGFRIGADDRSIVLEDNTFKLMGFDAAAVGAQPRKNATGNIEWVVPSTTELDDLKTRVTTLETNSGTLIDRVVKLENKINGTGSGTIDATIDSKIEDYCKSNVIRGVKVNGTLLDAIDGIVNILIAEQTLGIKGSEEVTIADDGTLGIGKININKIVQDEDAAIILDCNS